MNDPLHALRANYYGLIGTVAVAIAVAKIVGAENVLEPSRYAPPSAESFGGERGDRPTRPWPAKRPEPTLMFSSNDRSRWATVRALVDDGTYVIGRRASPGRPATDTGIVFEDGWTSIDKVMNPATGEFYSSKPPLFATLLAGEYWLLKKTLGWTFAQQKWPIVCVILLTVNVLPFALMLLLLARLIEDCGTTDFGKLLAFTTACVGTFLTTFSLTLNNHSPAACCVVFAVYPLLRKRANGETETTRDLFLAGCFGAMTATFDLPAAAFTAALMLPYVVDRRLHKLTACALGTLLPVIAFFAANYAALDRLTPAYSEFGGPWYEFEGSPWKRLKEAQAGMYHPGIDNAQESRLVYLCHCLLGHHGWFSLTPVWLVGIIGIALTLQQALRDLNRAAWTLPLTLAMTIALTLTLTVFFVFIQHTNNYGGNTSGLRWFFWLTPLWVLAVLRGGDWAAASRLRRGFATLLLGLSVVSVFYPAWNPWRSPWLLVLCERMEWVNYDRLVK